MSYKNPIELIFGQINEQINLLLEEKIYKAVQNVGVYVDKEELLKALQYDRNQYQKGYTDRDSEIVRCKDCKHRDPEDKRCDCGHDIHWQLPREDNWFCADGELSTNLKGNNLW